MVPNFKQNCCRLCFVKLPISNFLQIKLGVLQTDMVSTHISGACPHKDITNSTDDDDDALKYRDVSTPITSPHINLGPTTQNKMQYLSHSCN